MRFVGSRRTYWAAMSMILLLTSFAIYAAPTSWPRHVYIPFEVRYAVASIEIYFVARALLAFANSRGATFQLDEADVTISTPLWKRSYAYADLTGHRGKDPVFGRPVHSHDPRIMFTLRLKDAGLLMVRERHLESGVRLSNELQARGVVFDGAA